MLYFLLGVLSAIVLGIFPLAEFVRNAFDLGHNEGFDEGYHVGYMECNKDMCELIPDTTECAFCDNDGEYCPECGAISKDEETE